MKYLIIIFLILSSCVKPKSTFICGDHECINKKEADIYFKKNLSIQVKVNENNKKNYFDLVQLNLKKNPDDRKSIKILKSKKNKIKKLSKKEKKAIEDEIKKETKNADLAKKLDKKKANLFTKIEDLNSSKTLETTNVAAKKKINQNSKISSKRSLIIKKNKNEIKDICLIIEKCDIDEISKYLIKKNNSSDYPTLSF